MIRQLGATPNLLTLLRLVFIPFIATAVMESHFRVALALFVLAGITDGLDGLVARVWNQRTVLGQYLDPIADKLLLSTMFLMLSATHKVPWRVTVLVFSRDLGILLVSALLYATTSLRDYRPSVFGKVNTLAQILTLLLVLLDEVTSAAWVDTGKWFGLFCVMLFTVLSGVHYIWLIGQRLRAPSAPGTG